MKKLLFLNNKHRFLPLIILSFVFHVGIINAQDYREKIRRDSVKISYKWRKDKILKKDSPHVLILQLENLSSSKVSLSFYVLFYWKAQLHSGSKLKEYCLRPGKKIKGKKWGLAFNSTVFTMNEYLDPLFSWYIDDLKVDKNQSCDPGLKLKLEPAYP